MHGNKIDAPSLSWKATRNLKLADAHNAPVRLLAAGVFLCLFSGCFMTKAQGERLTHQMHNLEDEVAKLQSVRHDMEVLLVDQVKSLIDRIARLESQLTAFRTSLSEGSTRNSELVAELQNLRNELEIAQNRYRNLEQDQQSLVKNQMALKEAQNKIRVPPIKEDHFALGKKYFMAKKFDEAIFLFDQFVKDYPDEKDLTYQSHYYLGESNFKVAQGKEAEEEQERFYKKSVIAFQQVVEANTDNNMRVEALYKLGLACKNLGNTEGAVAAFKELLSKHKKSKRAAEAKSEVAKLEKQD
ncbi:MAG TPA: tetratricopeptide repeat protein [Myxococcota bacterium]|nr:tetratricopeptide repeat protein [Myxococcota bacterium]